MLESDNGFRKITENRFKLEITENLVTISVKNMFTGKETSCNFHQPLIAAQMPTKSKHIKVKYMSTFMKISNKKLRNILILEIRLIKIFWIFRLIINLQLINLRLAHLLMYNRIFYVFPKEHE